MECLLLASRTVAVDLRGDCVDWIPSRSTDQNTMKARQPEFRAIPQFDSGRWKLRLERVPAHPDNETTMGIEANHTFYWGTVWVLLRRSNSFSIMVIQSTVWCFPVPAFWMAWRALQSRYLREKTR